MHSRCLAAQEGAQPGVYGARMWLGCGRVATGRMGGPMSSYGVELWFLADRVPHSKDTVNGGWGSQGGAEGVSRVEDTGYKADYT